jgi:integrase
MRAHGEGTVIKRSRKRKDGTTVIRWVAIVTAPDGSRPSVWCETRAEAEKARQELVRLHHAGRLDVTRLTLGDFLQRWASSVDLAPATMKQHRNAITNHLVPRLGKVRLSALTPSDVDAYLSRTDLHPQTLRHHRATLRRALADAIRDGLVTRNVAALSRPPRMRKVERTYLDAADAMRLIEGTAGERVHAPLTVALTTGLRQAELLALTWRDIDWTAPSLTVRHTLHRIPNAPEGVYPWVRRDTKTDKSRRTVTLVPMAVDALREQQAQQAADRGGVVSLDALVFTTPAGHPIHGPNLLPPLHRAQARLGLPLVSWHDLRHATATMLLGAGVPLPVISRMLGHSTLRVTADLYAHVVPELERDAADRLQAALTGASGVRSVVQPIRGEAS